jgi:hypothetical protein
VENVIGTSVGARDSSAQASDLAGERPHLTGRLEAAGTSVRLELELDATLRQLDSELEVQASTAMDHRQLGMTWSPMGMIRTPSKLIVKGRLVSDG